MKSIPLKDIRFFGRPSRRGSECQHHQVDLAKQFSSIPLSQSPSSITIFTMRERENNQSINQKEKNVLRERGRE